jgi:hypothetical protein
MIKNKRSKYYYAVIASDRRERGNLDVINLFKTAIAEFIPSAKCEIASLCSQ